jgi:hypothetical protein
VKELSEIEVTVLDKGLFVPIARRIARDVKRVNYWSPHERAFETCKDQIGDGFPELTRLESEWDREEETDLWVCPDIGLSGIQRKLLRDGRIVWGARAGDSLEILRGKFLNVLQNETELPVPRCVPIYGITDLREHLKKREDKWIKISRYRGDWETLHWRSWDEDENTLDHYAVKFGPYREQVVFYVFDPIETKIEDGYDGYNIDGNWPSLCVHGMEAKDKAFLGAVQKFEDLPKELSVVNEAFGPVLAKYGYRSFFSSEVRITEEGESYFTDPTCRAGSPPSQVMAELFANFSDIIWQGANGNLIDPEPAAKIGVQGLIKLKGDRTTWSAMNLPEELDRWIKCGNCVREGGKLWFPPDDSNDSDVGWLVAIGDTIEQAIGELKNHAAMLPDGASCEFSELSDLLKQIKEAEDSGMQFTEQTIPEPEIVLGGDD